MLNRADEIFAARGILADAPRHGSTFGLGELVRFMNDPAVRLTADQTRRLFSDRNLSETYRRLKAQRTTFAVPALKAASDGSVADRAFPGGQVRIRPSKRVGQYYAIIIFTDPVPQPSPAALLLESTDGKIAKYALPGVDDAGQCMLILDELSPQDAALLELLRDPLASGVFIT